jgi:hypothetical protein
VGGVLAHIGSDLGSAFLADDGRADVTTFGVGVGDLREFAAAWDRYAAWDAHPGRSSPMAAGELLDLLESHGALLPGTVQEGETIQARRIRLGKYLERSRGSVVTLPDGRPVRISFEGDGRTKRPVWFLERVGTP